jgi:protein disulfide-isomerase A1
MDATENDIPPQAPFKVQGFPTIKFRAAGTAEFIDYSGDRSLESLIEFVEANRKSADSGDANEERSFEDDEEEPIEHDEL